jgi:hypothetical protein
VTEFVECREHGKSRPAYVCAHLVQTLRDQLPRGVIWRRDDDGCVNAYCDECETNLQQAGGEWNDKLEADAAIALICEDCFRRVLSINKKADLN